MRFKFLDKVSSVLGFRSAPTTILLVLTYAAIFISVLVTDRLPAVPQHQQGLDLDQAYTDLHQIAARPHPYNSHANDLVHAYILSRMNEVASRYAYIHIDNDLKTNASWAISRLAGVYFEGANILVKIDGTEPDRTGAVLFSAHYDSVSTAPGATDNGMGVATLMQMVEYLAQKRPRRTAIFNINNGEEDGLSGAHAFLEHPWYNLTDTFFNLEGAGAGDRPHLFRATSTAPLISFMNKHVPHPHSNVLSADAFQRGLVRSGTDYSVYTQGLGDGGIAGLDFAFYKGRSKYHTKYDSVPGTVGGRKALWAMMEAVRGAGLALLNDDNTHANTGGDGGSPVYFDLFAAVLIVFSMRTLLTVNIVFLTVGPVVLLVLAFAKYAVQRGRRHHYENDVPHSDTIWGSVKKGFRDLAWLKGLWRASKFWLAVVLGVGLQVLLVLGFIRLNPFIVYSQPYLVFTSSLALAYLSTVLTLKLPIKAHGILPEQQKLTTMLQLYSFTWILLVFATIAVNKYNIGGLYWITAWNIATFLGSVLCLVEAIAGAKEFAIDSEGSRPQRRSVRGIRYDIDHNGDDSRGESTEVETEPTEITPLIQQQRTDRPRSTDQEEGGAIGWWILQLLVVVAVPVILIFHIGLLLIEGLPQTLADGSSAVTAYAVISLIAILIILAMAPFSIKAHRSLTFIVLLIFAVSLLYGWLTFPFSQNVPLKVFFQQRLELYLSANDSSSAYGDVSRSVTTLTGVRPYIDRQIIPQLPSSWGKDVNCSVDTEIRPGLWTCAWDSELLPTPGSREDHIPEKSSARWLAVNATRFGPHAARISIGGKNTRSCRLYFDNARITRYHVHDAGSEHMQAGYEVPKGGLPSLRLWSRTWGRTFVVEVEWEHYEGGTQALSGRAACEWVEYESATAGAASSGSKIPALEEVLSFLPQWAVVSKETDGLVEAWGKFAV